MVLNKFIYFYPRVHYRKQIDKKAIAGKVCPRIKPQDLEGLRKDLTGICLFVTSTFGNGDPPKTGEALAEWIDIELTKQEELQHHRMTRSTSIDYEADSFKESLGSSGPGKSLYRRIAMKDKKLLGDLK